MTNLELIRVTYHLRSSQPIDIAKKADLIALGQTTDTWTPNERSGIAKLQKHRGVCLDRREVPTVPGSGHLYEIVVGFPPGNTEGDIPSLLTMIFGKVSLDGKIRLVNIEFPSSYLRGKGPRFGIAGLRKQTKASTGPLLMAIFKPCVGLSPKELGEMFYRLALGGLHLIKDDEILPDLSICPTEKRLDACLKAGERARKVTGRKTLYAVNITGRPSQLHIKAQRLKKLGAECFLLNVFAYGYGVLEELRSVGIPIMAHPALGGAIGGSQDYGISYKVILGSLMRLAGADIVLFPSSYGTVALPKEETDSICHALTDPTGALKRTLPGPSAGIHPGLVPQIIQDYGADVIINAGGGVHGHPQGAEAGARAFVQALEQAVGKVGPIESKPSELRHALRLWGQS